MIKEPNNFGIFCDWLQIHVKTREDFLEYENPWYNFKRTGQSKIWKNIYEVRSSVLGNVVAHYCTDAQECIMKRGHGILKIENNQLYCHEDLKEFVEKLLHRLDFKFVSITRLDIAFDIQKFYLNYDCMKFVRRYAEHKIIRLGGNRKTAAVMFQQNNRFHEFQTLYFGSKKSDLQIKMYNKTDELKKTTKPYISAIHKDIFKNDNNVWRIEFSIYSLQKAILENFEGKKFDYNSLDVLKIQNLYGIFIGLFEKHFEFRTCGKQKRIARMKKIDLWFFDLEVCKLNLKKQNELIKISSRGERVFLKRLNELCDTQPTPELTEKYNDIFAYAVEKLNVKNVKKDTQEVFISKVKKQVKSDRSAKVFLSKLKKLHSGKDYDENLNEAVKEISGKVVSEYQLQDYAIKKELFYKGYENYIFDVEQFKRIEGNEERLDNDFKQMMQVQGFMNENDFIKTV